MIVALVATVVPVVPASAQPTSDGAVLAHGVRQLAATLDGLAATPELATFLPMTRRSPADILGFPGAISAALADAATELGSSDLGAQTIDAGAADVVIGAKEPDGTIPITITAEVTRTEDAPVLYADVPAPEDVDGDGEDDPARGGIVLYGDGDGSAIQDVAATLTVSLPLTFDPDAGDDPALPGQIDLERALSLSDHATVGVTVVADDDEIAFSSRYGFTDVDVTGAAVLDLSMEGDFTDPDGVDGIRPSEWRTTLLDDLVDMQVTNGNGTAADVDIALALDSLLIDGAQDGALSYEIADAGSDSTYIDDPEDERSPETPVLAPKPELARFANVTADDALAALAQLSTAVAAMQAQIDARFPMLTARLSDAYDPAGELTTLVEEQGSAAIVCGRANTLPPSGAELPGTTWYCQALTSQEPTSVSWSAPDGVVISGDEGTTTVGTSPTSNIVVTNSPGEPALELEFTVEDAETGGEATFVAKPRFRSVQELEGTLDDLQGSTIGMTYDPVTASLVFDVELENDPEAITAAVDVGDALYMDTHLRNVSTARTVSGTEQGGIEMGALDEPVTVDVGMVSVRTGFGLLLQDDISAVDAGTPVASLEEAPLDRYVVSVADGAELAVADVSFSGEAFGLGGTLGYLEVDLTADTFRIADSDSDEPVLAADLDMPDSYAGVPTSVGGTAGTVESTMLLRHLLTGSTMRDNLAASYDLAAEVALSVEPSDLDLGLGGDLGLTVDVDWPDWPVAPPVVTTGGGGDDYATWLESFDIVPSATGTHTGIDGAAALTDAHADLLTAFGFRAAAGDPVDATLHNVTTGASCAPFVVVDATTLSCGDGGLVGGTSADPEAELGSDGLAPADNDWAPGDVWEVRGDPTAMRSVVYEGLYELANGLALSDAEGHRARLPLVGLRPADMTPQFATVRDTISELLDRMPALAVEEVPAEDTDAEAEPPAAPPAAASLQAMLAELEEALDAIPDADGVQYGDATVGVSMTAMANPGATDVGEVPHLLVSVDVPVEGTTGAQIRIDLGEASTLDILGDALGRVADAVLDVEFSSTASLTLAVPLSLDVPIEDLVAMEGTGVRDLEAQATSDALTFTGSLGALGLVFGTDARLDGTHGSPTGTHDGEVIADGTHTGALDGTAGEGTTDTSVSAAGVDFRGFDGATATRGGDMCTVSSAAVGRFSCTFADPDGDGDAKAPVWKKDDTFTIASTRTDALIDGGATFGDEIVAGLTVINEDQEGASCTVADTGITAHVLPCTLSDGKAWAAGDAYRIVDGSTLVDPTRLAEGATTFTQLLEGVELADVTITAGDGSATCTPTAVSDTSISCDAAWTPGTTYRIDIGGPTTTLVDETTRFDGLDLEGMVLTNGTDEATCVVAATTRHTVTCAAALAGDGTPQWDDDDRYEAGGIGIARFDLEQYELMGLETALIDDYLADLSGSPTGAEVTCNIPGTDVTRTDDVCALLSVELKAPEGEDGRYLGLVTYAADIAGGTSEGTGPTVPQALDDAAAGEEPIEWSLLSTAFTEAKRALGAALEGTLADEPFPLIGLDVSAGTKLEEALDELELLIAERAETDAPAIVATTTMTEARTAIGTFFTAAFSDVSIDGLKLAELLGEVDVTLLCEGSECTDENIGADIDDARVKFTIGYNIADGSDAPGQGCATCEAVLDPQDTSLEFDIGLDGLPIDGSAGLTTKAGWSYDVDLGIDRVNGPYIGSSTDSGQFELGANVGLANAPNPTDCAQAPTGFSTTRCATLRIGLFNATVYDGDDPDVTDGPEGSDGGDARSQLDLKLTANLSEVTGEDGKVGAAELIAGTLPSLGLSANATANVDLAFRTAVDESGSLPSLQGQIHVGFSANGSLASVAGVSSGSATSSYEDVVFDNLTIDLGTFIDSFVAPIAAEVKRYTEPFKPIIDLLRAPIPVLSDLAKMTGNAAVTILTLIQEAGYNTQLVNNVLDMIEFANDMADTVASGALGLGPSLTATTAEKGGFVTKPKDAAKGPCGATKDDGTKQPKDCTRSSKRGGTSTKTKVTQLQKCGTTGLAPCTGKELTRSISRTVNKPKLTGTALTFPFLNDASQIFGMLMGEGDAVLVRFDAGTLAASAGMSVSWGPFMAGPVPIDISIGATFSFSARFAMGYDTRGLLNMLRQEPEDFDPAALLDGVYIDDLDVNGSDVPEITLALTVTAGASVSVKIFKVGLEGGVTVSVNFNLNDPDRDGRLRIEEISRFGENPLCLFEVRGLLEFFLRFFVEIDLKFWTKRWSVTLFHLRPPIQLFEVRCDPPPPELARLTEVEGRQVLRLNAGRYVGDRNYREDVPKEKFVLRQIGPNRVSVEAFGLYEEHDVAEGIPVWADMGDAADTVQLLEGADTAGTAYPFTTGSVIRGGTGNDRLTGGEGIDDIDGGAGNDTIGAGGGDDTVQGGDDPDVISGSLGNDILSGGGGTDSITGDAGSDVIHGGGEDDDLTGGPGLDQRRYDRLPVDRKDPALLDGADVVTGGAGADAVKGHAGDDVLLGDVMVDGAPTDAALRTALAAAAVSGDASSLHASFTGSCALDLAGDDADRLEGEVGDDLLLGGAGHDDLDGGQGGDRLCGNAGDDHLEGDSPTATTGSGDDTLDGGGGHDRLFGRAGDDTATGGPGDDLVDGGDGHDAVGGGLGSDVVLGGAGHDIGFGDEGDANGATIDDSGTDAAGTVVRGDDATGPQSGSSIVCSTSVPVFAGKVDLDGDGLADDDDDGRIAGHAVVDGLVELDGLAGSAGDNGVVAEVVVSAGLLQMADGTLAAPGMVVGGNADCVFGDAGHDALFGGADDDRIFADIGNDHVEGGVGDDWLRGAQGDDEVHGDAGLDEILGDSGEDRIFGGADADLIRGGLDDDVIEGNGGADEIHGDTGADHIVGGSGAAGEEDDEGADGVGDRIFGGPADDVIAGDNATIAPDRAVTLHDVGVVDAALAGPDLIDGAAGVDHIHGQGEDDAITGGEGADYVEGNGGADTIAGDAGADRLVGGSAAAGVQDENTDDGDPASRDGDHILGGSGADVIAGDNAVLAADGSVILLDVASSTATPEDAADGPIFGDDTLVGAGGADRLFGQGGGDSIDAGTEDDHAEGGSGVDVITGGAGDDHLVGGTSDHATLRPAGSTAHTEDTTTFGRVLDDDDTIHGDAGDDLVLGDDVALDGTTVSFDTTADLGAVDGDDTLHGGSGDDRIWGQRGDDEAHGDDGHDTILGDLATVDPLSSGPASWPGGAPRYDIDLVTPDVGGSDELFGGDGDDRIYAGHDDDLVEGGIGDDHLEGNGGADHVHGHSQAWRTAPDEAANAAMAAFAASDQDDVIGGSSSVHPTATSDGAADTGDHLVGDAGHDVVIGDNGDIDRVPDGAEWDLDDITLGHRRDVTLFDRQRTGSALAAVSGDDTMLGGDQNDRMYGQGGDDHLRGEAHEDQLQGNQGGDWLEGGDDADDVIGGSDTVTDDGVGELDGADRIHGGAGQDVIAGDNAGIVRVDDADAYLATFGRFRDFPVHRSVTLHDLAGPVDPTRSGADVIVGGSDADLVFGQDGDDLVFGGGDDDYVEGNGGTDQLVGDRLPEDLTVTGSLVVVGVPDLPASLVALQVRLDGLDPAVPASAPEARDGAQGTDGQDDLIGGSSRAAHRDGRDVVAGDGGADMVLGDNGTLVRPLDGSRYRTYETSSDPTRIVRHSERFDVGGSPAASGGDLVLGGTGNDAVWGQDGMDELWGQDGEDELFGELGDDRVFGGNGDDALLGDRGGVVNTRLPATGDRATGLDSSELTTSGPPFLTYRTFLAGEIDRRVDLTAEEPGSVGGPLDGEDRRTLASTGLTVGGADVLRGGPGADVLHGGAGADVMNGDSGGDALFGYGGSDVLWGGRGSADPSDPNARGADDRFVDHLFGGRGGDTSPWAIVFDGADVLDYRPRTAAESGGPADPAEWFAATDPYADPEGVPVETATQHNQGVDWMYGGWDRDVMQANLEAPGPNDGDRMIDWSGVFNLYTACSPDYGGYNAIRSPSPSMERFLHGLAHARGVGETLADVSKSGTSAYEALGFVYKADVKKNTGKPYPGTPGHLTKTACTPEP